MNQIELAINMLFILKTQGIVKKESIADQLEISTKMVQRLRTQLEYAGYEIEIKRGIYGGYRLLNNSFFPISSLTTKELDILANGYKSIINLDLPFNTNEFKLAFQKVIGNHPTNSPGLSFLQTQELLFDTDKLDEIIGLLQHAILERKIITISYYNEKNYEFEPYEIFQVDVAWYVIGYQRYNDVRIFRLDRIQNIEIHSKKFIKDEKFNLFTHLGKSGFKIENPIILKGRLKNSSYLHEFRLSDHQIVDGEYFELKFYSLARAKRFVLEQGSQLVIDEPQALKDFQRDEAKRILNQVS